MCMVLSPIILLARLKKNAFFLSDSRLGHKIQGVLCDGESNEVVASTVVNCLKINEGNMKPKTAITVICAFLYIDTY